MTVAATIENYDISATGTAKLNITGNALANNLVGNDVSNVLNGGAGADTLPGGLGDDIYTVDNASDQLFEQADQGTDLVNTSVSFNLLTNGADVENITLTGAAAINAIGNNSNNVITGNSAINTLRGNDGSDTLLGLGGNDTIYGGFGDDLIRGGAGNDTLTGDVGADTFWFDTATSATTNKDIITDFVSGTDKLQFSQSVLAALGATGQFAADDQRFWSSNTGLAHDATDCLIYNTTTGALSYDTNGSATGGAVIIELLGAALGVTAVLAATDIFVV
ncbi:MAG: hypothetical protein RLZ75_3186 [Pseudomonadota bacterium]